MQSEANRMKQYVELISHNWCFHNAGNVF